MSDEHKGLPVPGYTPQSEANVDLGRESKEIEELVLRQIDLLEAENNRWRGTSRKPPFDPRWLAIARTQIEQGFMALNRAIFKPKRAPLQDDDPDPAPMVAPAKPTQHATTSPGPVNCNIRMRAQGEAYPRTCERCGLDVCPFFHSDGRSKI